MILKELCPNVKCKVKGQLKSETAIGSKVMKLYSCGHFEMAEKTNPFDLQGISKAISEVSSEPLVSHYDVKVSETALTVTFDEMKALAAFDDDGNVLDYASKDESFFSIDRAKSAYEFQIEGVHFAEKTGLNCLIADEMGLGKTVQALIAMKRAKKRTLICVKGSIMFQWAAQVKTWNDDNPLGVMPIVNRDCIIPGFNIYIISIDFLSRKGVLDKLLTLGIELLVVDECQNFKDNSSKRTVALIKLIQGSQIKHKIFLSGTPIKNRANEYFTILNLLAPNHFVSYANFCRYWLIPNEKGVYTRIDPGLLDKFHELTSNWIIRREVKDVQKNLPALTRDYQLIEIDDPLIKNAYNAELDLFQNFMKTGERFNSTMILGWLAKMRAITGKAKIPFAIEYAEQFLDQKEDSLVIGIHHHDVRDVLFHMFSMKGYSPLKFSGEDNQFQKERIKQSFMRGDTRLMVMNIIAGGTGTDGLQKVCHNALVLERMWSSADEEQFEKRFQRDGQSNHVDIVYPIALGTIDEWFDKLVGRSGPPMTGKRKIVAETLGDSSFDPAGDESLLRELTEMTLSHRL